MSIGRAQAELAGLDKRDKALQTTHVKVLRNELIYRPDGGPSFFRDIARKGHLRDTAAAERLQRHMLAEADLEKRAGGVATVASGGFKSLVVPSYLREYVDQAPVQGKSLWNLGESLPLPPEGQTVTLQGVQVAMATAAQSDQNTAVASATYTVVDLVVPVTTYAGELDVSYQAVDRSVHSDREMYRSLVRDYDRQLERDVVNGPGTAGRHLGVIQTPGVHSIPLTGSSYGNFRHAVLLASQAISASNEGEPRSDLVLVLHERRWSYLLDQTSGDAVPFIDITAESGEDGRVGKIAGVPVHLSSAIPVNVNGSQDVALLLSRPRLAVADASIQSIRWEPQSSRSASEVTGTMVGHGYSMARLRRPSAAAIVTGAGLAAVLT